MAKRVMALAGGVGGSKLALGLSKVLPSNELTLVVNTGDDFRYCGLQVCPDIDTVTYTLAGISNKELGWGVERESWNCFNALKHFDESHWFHLGDRDIATHLTRTQMLDQGKTLSQVTSFVSARLGVKHTIVPMSDEASATIVHAGQGALSFQEYFVKEKCAPRILEIEYGGISAKPSNLFLSVITDSNLDAVIFCPSNPFLSIAPILNVSGIHDKLRGSSVPKIAVSPLIGVNAVKGPTAKIMSELGMDCSSVGIAQYYKDVVDALVINEKDADQKNEIEKMGVRCFVANTLMNSDENKQRLAMDVLDFVEAMSG